MHALDFRRAFLMISLVFAVMLSCVSCPISALGQQKKTTASSAPAKPATKPAQQPTKPTTPQTQQSKQTPTNQPGVRPQQVNPFQPGGNLSQPGIRPPALQPASRPSQPGLKQPYEPRPGEQFKNLSSGGRIYSDPRSGRTVTTDSHGVPRRIEIPNGIAGRTVITRGPRGERQVITGRPGNRVVSYGTDRGFVERPLRPGYISRTYVNGGHSYAHVYREYHYRDQVYYRYVPDRVYAPGFYVWAMGSWGPPVPYRWYGLATPAPWFNFYAGYFTPYPAYNSADLWLTDYVVSQDLQAGYQNLQASNEGQTLPPPPKASGEQPSLTPELKQMIANEVRGQLADERAQADHPVSQAGGQPADGGEQPPPALKDSVFIVSSNLDVTTGGNPCTLTPGDMIRRTSAEVSTNGNVSLEVLTSQQGDCAENASIQLDLPTLQEMHNQFREQMDAGLKVLTNNPHGLPAGPSSSPRVLAEGTVSPTQDVDSQVTSQNSLANQAESQMKQSGN